VASSAAENPRSRPRSINYWQIPAEEVGNLFAAAARNGFYRRRFGTITLS
jgi:hypothetical protein